MRRIKAAEGRGRGRSVTPVISRHERVKQGPARRQDRLTPALAPIRPVIGRQGSCGRGGARGAEIHTRAITRKGPRRRGRLLAVPTHRTAGQVTTETI